VVRVPITTDGPGARGFNLYGRRSPTRVFSGGCRIGHRDAWPS
jgi:hypothetical protein